MMVSPRKLSSHCTHTTINRGVDAKEIEIANTRLDGDSAGGGDARTLTSPTTDQSSASYIQVVVQKQRRAGRRVPTSSSPTQQTLEAHAAVGTRGAAPAAVLLACPAFAALHQPWNGFSMIDSKIMKEVNTARESGTKEFHGNLEGIHRAERAGRKPRQGKTSSSTMWRKVSNIASGKRDFCLGDGPERVEVYQFERGCDVLWARGAARVTRVERLARALARPASDLLAELLALLRLAVALPAAVLLHVERCALATARVTVCGAVQTAADEVLKPALALSYNAVARPPLVVAVQVAGALRDVLRPFWLALGDALEPLARLCASVRLVHVEVRCNRSHHDV